MLKTIQAAFAAAMMIAAPAAAADELGPAVGARAPHDLTLADHKGAAQSFDKLVGENGVALFFVRSVDWCPFCKAQAEDVSKRMDEFEERGLSIVFVSYDAPEKQRAFAEKADFRPALLSDADIEAINAFGIRNESAAEGSRWYGIPHPVVFILDRDRTVRAKFFEDDFLSNDKSYRNRPAVDAILEGADAAMAKS